MQDEIIYLRHNWHKEGLPPDWRLLAKTGFQVGPHIDMLYRSLHEDNTPEERRSKTIDWLFQTDEDIKGFNLEYLAEGLVFPIFYKIDPIRQEVVAPLYGNKQIEDLVSEEERNGVVKRTVANTLKPMFLSAPDRSVAVMSSPSGWSGLTTQEGMPITFPDSQTYIFQKQGLDIVGFTIRTDFNNGEHRDLIERLGGGRLSDHAPIERYVSSVGYINGSEYPNIDFTDIVNQMRTVRFESKGDMARAYKHKTWDEVFENLNNRENLWEFDAKTAEIVDEFKEWVLMNAWTRRELEEALAVTILRISSVLTGKGAPPEIVDNEGIAIQHERGRQEIAYGVVLSDVEERGGCAGGGSGSGLVEKLLSGELLLSLTPKYLQEGDWFTCPKCEFKATGPIGNGGCPGCGLTKEQHAKKGGIVC